jgi:hypothetical protein
MKPQEDMKVRVPLLLCIGVTGHRTEPVDLQEKCLERPIPDMTSIRAIIREVLGVIRFAFQEVTKTHYELDDLTTIKFQKSNGNILRIVSGLASGADQWVAVEAIKQDYELEAILPFARVDYLKDYTIKEDAESLQYLLKKAKRIIELEGKSWVDETGKRKHDSNSYENVGRQVISSSDIILAIWDGQESRGKGGTGQVVMEALQHGIPVIWIPWSLPEKWQLIMLPYSKYKEPLSLFGERDRLSETVKKLIHPQISAKL